MRTPFTLIATMALAGCTSLSVTGSDRPMAFHDSRLQYALLTNDRATLKKDFEMHLEPSPTERIVAGLMLPFGGAVDTVFWPVSYAITRYLDAQLSEQIRQR
ncbi:hypothetical protein [Methylocaldum szegediense]|nr:hypothetical protein [Methylocaldum szegediense]